MSSSPEHLTPSSSSLHSTSHRQPPATSQSSASRKLARNAKMLVSALVMPYRLVRCRLYLFKSWAYSTLPPRWAARVQSIFSTKQNFIFYHYAYFIFTTILSSLILWSCTSNTKDLRFIDAWFVCVSAMTLAGLNTVNLSELNTVQQFILYFLTLIGSAIFVSIFIVWLRRAAFKRRLSNLKLSTSTRGIELAENDVTIDQGQLVQGAGNLPTIAEGHGVSSSSDGTGHEPFTASSSPITLAAPRGIDHHHVMFNEPASPRNNALSEAQPVNSSAPASASNVRRRRASSGSQNSTSSRLPYLSFTPTIDRNSNFSNLTNAQRLELGGVEYRALTLLAYLVPLYFVIWQVIASLGMFAYTAHRRPEVGTGIVGGQSSNSTHVGTFWYSTFNAVSAFNNNGMSLIDANMTIFSGDWYILTTMALCILAGHTCYPIFLRIILWSFQKLLSWRVEQPRPTNQPPRNWRARETRLLETVTFLLEHPRRCYTNLFKRRQTYWLAASVLVLNGTDWVMFKLLNINNKKLAYLTTSEIIIDGLFQAVAVRCGGFYVVSIANIRIALQVLYVVMMYVSVYPVAVAIRHSNVYEEKTLGIYAQPVEIDDEDLEEGGDDNESVLSKRSSSRSNSHRDLRRRMKKQSRYFLRHQVRQQLAHDLWLLAFAIFLILFIEASHFEDDPVNFSAFNVMFEVVSAYGCVGISLGYPGVNYSFSGTWHTGSKLILTAVMLRGRHRGLPMAIDGAISLPAVDHLVQGGDEQSDHASKRRMTDDVATSAAAASA